MLGGGVAALGLVAGLVISGGGHGKPPRDLVATQLPAALHAPTGQGQVSPTPVTGAAAGGSVPSPLTAAARGQSSSAPDSGTGGTRASTAAGSPTGVPGSSAGETAAASTSPVRSSSTGATHASSSSPPASGMPLATTSSGASDASSGSPAGSGDGGGDHAAPVSVSDPDGSSVPAGGAPVSFTATLTPPQGLPDPTGSMTFTLEEQGSGSQQTACTVAVHSASATCPISFPTAGRYEVAAFYVPGSASGGRSTYVPSQGALAVTAGTAASGTSSG